MVQVYQLVGNSTGAPIGNSREVEIGTGAAYTFTIQEEDSSGEELLEVVQDINSNDVPLLWIVPQFFIITVAEVMISITGLEFAYKKK